MATGKTGADAIFMALKRVCIVLTKYRPKLVALIVTLVETDVLTSAQGTVAQNFINVAVDACDVFSIIADNSGF